jgi:hypothetical protein
LLEILHECFRKGSWDCNKCVLLLIGRGSCRCDHSLCPIFFAKPRRCLWRMPGEGKGGGVVLLVEYKVQKFKYNDLADVIVGTGVGVPGKKTEPIKARFKGEVMTVRGLEFECKPLVGSKRGPCPQFPRDCVFKVTAFGACVLGTRRTRYFSDLKPRQKER